MLSRFTKLFLVVVVILILSASVTLYPPHLNIHAGAFFGDSGAGNEYHALPINVQGRPLVMPHATGGVIMSKLGNETAKAALGRATWKLLHTMTLRYPEHPTDDEREALRSYLYLTSRLYPCGECATEFQQLLELYPPQTSSRLSASGWLCFVHNKVNERLEKPIFDCAHLDDEYDCGCGHDGDASTTTMSSTPKDELTGADLIRGGR